MNTISCDINFIHACLHVLTNQLNLESLTCWVYLIKSRNTTSSLPNRIAPWSG